MKPQSGMDEVVDVLIVGAGPSGAMASVLLQQQGLRVLVLEKQQFPRFSIGESLLPQSMVYLEKAGMTEVVTGAGYQLKNGACFRKQGAIRIFNFEEKFSPGPGTTFQVKRADFDKRLADHAASRGVAIRYRHEVNSVEIGAEGCQAIATSPETGSYQIQADFILDASGFGRVLPRLLALDKPSDFPERHSVFCHLRDNIGAADFDRNKIHISVHPHNNAVWYWLIPFSDGTSSFGVVGPQSFFAELGGEPENKLHQCLQEEPFASDLLKDAVFITQVREIRGFAANVTSLYGNRFALLGNAAEFLDPVFSSGVTIAFKSADLAATILSRQFRGESVDWEEEYVKPLMVGVDTFRTFVSAWYDGRLQDIIFHQDSSDKIRRMICSILAGYAWDTSNPYVLKSRRRINALAEICKN